MKEKLLDVKQSAKILGINPKTLYQWKWKGLHLPFFKIGKSLRISERDLYEFIRKNKIKR